MNDNKVLKQFEQIVALKIIENYVFENFIISKRISIIYLFVFLFMSFITLLNVNDIVGQYIALVLLLASSLFLALVTKAWISTLFDDGISYSTFDELKKKMALQTGLNEELIEPFLDKEECERNPILHCLRKNNELTFFQKRLELEKEFLGDCSEQKRKDIEQIAEHLKDCSRSRNKIKFQCFKRLIKQFNNSVEKRGFDDETLNELVRLGSKSDLHQKINKPAKIEIID